MEKDKDMTLYEKMKEMDDAQSRFKEVATFFVKTFGDIQKQLENESPSNKTISKSKQST